MKNNNDAFESFLKESTDITLAIARGTLVANANEMLENREQVLADGKNSIISGELSLQYAEEVIKHLGFNK